MRSLPLKTLTFQPIGAEAPLPFVYADVMRLVLHAPRPGAGISTDDGLKATDIGGKVRDAAARGLASVMLEEVEWSFLCSRLADFRWAAFDDSVADFVRAVRDAPKIDPNAVS